MRTLWTGAMPKSDCGIDCRESSHIAIGPKWCTLVADGAFPFSSTTGTSGLLKYFHFHVPKSYFGWTAGMQLQRHDASFGPLGIV